MILTMMETRVAVLPRNRKKKVVVFWTRQRVWGLMLALEMLEEMLSVAEVVDLVLGLCNIFFLEVGRVEESS